MICFHLYSNFDIFFFKKNKTNFFTLKHPSTLKKPAYFNGPLNKTTQQMKVTLCLTSVFKIVYLLSFAALTSPKPCPCCCTQQTSAIRPKVGTSTTAGPPPYWRSSSDRWVGVPGRSQSKSWAAGPVKMLGSDACRENMTWSHTQSGNTHSIDCSLMQSNTTVYNKSNILSAPFISIDILSNY